jgi:uridylate kinase
MEPSQTAEPSPTAFTPRWRRILIKLSGEILAGEQRHGLDPAVLRVLAEQLAALHQTGCEIALVVGGGNYIRGQELVAEGLERAAADYMGMLGTVINAMALQDQLERLGPRTRVLTAIKMEQVAEPFIRRRAIRHLEKGRVIIMAGGTGNPYFSTDTAAVLRAVETGCEVLLKATKVDGVYSADPMSDPAATFYRNLTHREVLERGLRVMDLTAITLAMENRLPIVVFNVRTPGNLARVLRGEAVGTLVEEVL